MNGIEQLGIRRKRCKGSKRRWEYLKQLKKLALAKRTGRESVSSIMIGRRYRCWERDPAKEAAKDCCSKVEAASGTRVEKGR